jgi:tRNA nucleotidyltransferase (CCA-adding enzyme)
VTGHEPGAVLAALARYPALGRPQERTAVVGGFARDVWLGREPRELDLVVEGDAVALARRLGGEVTVHEAFGTASASGPGWRIDVATARRERYPAPGALPEVEPATLEEDLERRDFTVNALAVTVDEGELLAVDDGVADLGAGVLRVLHDESFIDDPTRLIRLARYAERLGFAVDPRTAELADAATFATLSGARLGAELRLAGLERDPGAVLARLERKLPIELDRGRLDAALAIAPPAADRSMLVLGACAHDASWLDTLELTARERTIALACMRAPIPESDRPSALWRAWHAAPIEAVAIAGARGAPARRWIEELRGVALEIDGDDLIAAGIAQGPEIGRRLERTLMRRLDGDVAPGREPELADALAER